MPECPCFWMDVCNCVSIDEPSSNDTKILRSVGITALEVTVDAKR